MTQPGLPELIDLERIIKIGAAHLDARVMCEVESFDQRFPVYAIAMGNPALDVPAVGFFGGFHGLERIGSHVVIAYLDSLVTRLQWDTMLHRQLESVRLVFMPVVNPGGMWQATRANPNGVDLMRNAPLDGVEGVPFLIGGQRFSAKMPWYRGPLGAPMEAENLAVCQVVEEELLSRNFSIVVDCHSGFGIHDRVWFPYAHTARPVEHLAEIHALKDIFEKTHPNHRYVFEPQSRQYLAHGDLWDYLYQRACAKPGRVLLPLTLELGSWLWIKKNPRQIFSRHGIFNPLVEHRQQRVIRRQMSWFDFLSRAACSHRAWVPTEATRDQHLQRALTQWYHTTSR
ncbi:MAG: carboxypeptidase [Rhodocyclales bacterium]|nr:carboxypeptidase [Rhodocyclales bacterium]